MPEWMTGDYALAIARALVTLAIGWVLAKAAGGAIERLVKRYTAAQETMIARRIAFYGVFAIAVVAALQALGFQLGVLLGAAGILTVALGFASQTSASNLISGLFLIGERAFAVGDVIRIGSTTGEVLSIDLLSVKLRTFDNLFVRVPNESVIKSEITNLTRFPIRRLDVQVGVAYREEIGRVREALMRVAEANPLCLDEPAPLFIFKGFGDSALLIQFSVWARRERFRDLTNTIHASIKQEFDALGIEIPFPQRTVSGGDTPISVRIVEGDEVGAQPESRK